MPGIFTENITESISVPATPTFAASLNGPNCTVALDMKVFNKGILVVNVGALGSTASTINAALYESANSDGTGQTLISGSEIATITASSRGAVIGIDAAEMTQRYLYGRVTVGVVATPASAMIFGTDCRYGPANSFDYNSTQVQRIWVGS